MSLDLNVCKNYRKELKKAREKKLAEVAAPTFKKKKKKDVCPPCIPSICVIVSCHGHRLTEKEDEKTDKSAQ